MNKPQVSVIVTTYNSEKFVREAICSVIDQTFTDWELIVVDDGSTDNTCNKLEEIHDERIKIIRLESNSGRPAIPRNEGIRAASGEFIFFLDSDDILMPACLEVLFSMLKKPSDADFVYARHIEIGGNTKKALPGKGYAGCIFGRLLKGNFMSIGRVMMRRSVLERTGLFNEDKALAASEDYELWLRISYYYKAAFADKVLMNCRQHPKSISALKRSNIYERQIKVLKSAFSVLDVPEKQKRCALSFHYAVAGQAYLKERQYDMFKEHIMQSICLHFNFKAFILWFSYIIFRGKVSTQLINFLSQLKNRRFFIC